MKKNYIVLFILVCFSITIGKAQTVINSNILVPTKKIAFDKSILNKHKVAKSSTTLNQGWFNYETAVQSMYGANSSYGGNYLFPDSLGYFDYTTNANKPAWINHIAELVDFDSPMFSMDPSTSWVATSPSNAFNIDSISIVYAYIRNHPNPAIVDTLIFTIYDNSTPTNLSLSMITGTITANYFVDTIPYQSIGYNPQSNIICSPTATTSPQIAPNGEYKFKLLLTSSDTATTLYHEKKFSLPIPFSSTRNNLVVTDVSFIPGYTYTPTQLIDVTANAFIFASMEENGTGPNGSYMNHIDCGYGSSLCDYSKSYVLTKDSHYAMAGNWNYRYMPAIAFPMVYPYEHHLIFFHLTDTTTIPCQVNSMFTIVADTLNPGVYNGYEASTGNGALSYLWDFGDGTTSNIQYPLHQYTVPGQYIVCLTVTSTVGASTCSSTYCDSSSVHKMAAGFLMSQFNVIPSIVTSINETEKNIDIKTYPNPISDELVIEFTNKGFEKLSYTLIDALGRIILSKNFENDKTTINTSQLSQGFYNLNIINADNKKIKCLKIIK